MEQEKHLTEQEKPKSVTRAAARHLRRKRLKDARRAEKQSSEFVNGVNDNGNKETNDATENNKIEEIQQTSIKFENLFKLSLLSLDLTENKAQDQCNYHKGNNTEIERMRSRTVDIDSEEHSTHSSHSSRSLDGSKCETETLQISQTKNDEGKEHTCTSPTIDAILNKNLSSALDSLSSVIKTNTFDYPDITPLDLNLVEDSTKNKKNFKLSKFPNVNDFNSSARNNIVIENNETGNRFVNNTLSCSEKKDITERDNSQNRLVIDSNDEKTNAYSRKPESLITMIDGKSSVPEKTREEIKAEREAKKAAKAIAKAKTKTKCNKVTETVGEVKNNKFSIANCEMSQNSVKAGVEADAQGSQEPLREFKSEKSAVQSSNVSMQNSAQPEKNNEGKSKAELRAERRAKQEAQRAAKQQQQSSTKQQQQQQVFSEKQQSLAKDAVPKSKKEAPSVKSRVKDTISQSPSVKESVEKDAHGINLFKHLYHKKKDSVLDNSSIHPAIVKLGVQYASKTIVGSNARCVALLIAIKRVVEDFEKPEQTDFIPSLRKSLKDLQKYLQHCRPPAVSMNNAMHHLVYQMEQFSSLSDKEAKNKLKGVIDTYIREQIQLADQQISITIQRKISDGNVILTYGYSSLIYKILVDAHAAGKQFRVIVVDGRPWLEGKEQLRLLAKHGIECSYILINALSFIMPEVSKVFLGAHAVFANGAVMSRAGTAQVALMAKAFNVPVLVPCETYKSCGRVQTDSIVYNELGNADELVMNSHQSSNSEKPVLTDWKMKKWLNLLNITYDVMPADLVTAVVTELAILPCTSVPVILRIKPSEI